MSVKRSGYLPSVSKPLQQRPPFPLIQRPSIPREKIRIGEVIGHGAFGVVHKAELHGCEVVAKFLRARGNEDDDLNDDVKEKLSAEAAKLESKHHDNIVQFKGISNALRCIVTEYCPNGSLYDVLTNKERHPHLFKDYLFSLKCLEETAAGIMCLHHEEPILIHCDLKPCNIFFDGQWKPKIGDFGLSQIAVIFDDRFTIFGPVDVSRLVLLYQPPEVIAGQLAKPKVSNYSRESDVYSYGVLIQDLLKLEPHFGIKEGPQMAVQLWKAMSAVKDGNLRPEIPEDRSRLPENFRPCLEPLVDLMNECCDPDPKKRPDIEDVHARVRKIHQDLIKETLPGAPPPKYTAMRICGISLSVFCLAGLFSVVLCYAVKDIRSAKKVTAESLSGCAFLLILCVLLLVFLGYRSRERFVHYREDKERMSRYPGELEFGLRRKQKDKKKVTEIDVVITKEPPSSPFAKAFSQTQNPLILAVNKDVGRYDVPPNWWEICKRLKEELPDSLTCMNAQAARRFCMEHMGVEQMDRHVWQQNFVKNCIASPGVLSTRTWKDYETWCNIPLDAKIDISPNLHPFGAGPSTPVAIPVENAYFRQNRNPLQADTLSTLTPLDKNYLQKMASEERQGIEQQRIVAPSRASTEWSTEIGDSSMFQLADRETTRGDDKSHGYSFSPSTASMSPPKKM